MITLAAFCDAVTFQATLRTRASVNNRHTPLELVIDSPLRRDDNYYGDLSRVFILLQRPRSIG